MQKEMQCIGNSKKSVPGNWSRTSSLVAVLIDLQHTRETVLPSYGSFLVLWCIIITTRHHHHPMASKRGPARPRESYRTGSWYSTVVVCFGHHRGVDTKKMLLFYRILYFFKIHDFSASVAFQHSSFNLGSCIALSDLIWSDLIRRLYLKLNWPEGFIQPCQP